MIDRRSPQQGEPNPTAAPTDEPAPESAGASSDLFSELFDSQPAKRHADRPARSTAAQSAEPGGGSHPGSSGAVVAAGEARWQSGALAPEAPTNLQATGLSMMQVCELVLKQLYLQGNLIGVEIARHIRLPFQVVHEALRLLKDEKCVEIASGDLIGPASYRYNLTELGRRRARESFEQCRYVGPAPVPLSAYVEQCRRQTVCGITCSEDALQDAFGDFIIRAGLLEELGPAVCSGTSIFIYGPPGNGKTMIAKGLGKFLNHNGGDIYVPYAISAENSVITLFDPTLHQATDSEDLTATEEGQLTSELNRRATDKPMPDARWRRVRRPVVMTGGELTLEMLDLRYNKESNFYTAPLHIKANGGVFLIDDFGRQIVSPRDLLNRWILPLEERVDYLTLATGKKFAVPFEQLIIFSTNLDPRELVDEAFLRRIRHKIKIGAPERDLYSEVFKLNCRLRDIEFRPEAVEFLYRNYYDKGKPPRSSDPRDLLEIAKSISRFKNQKTVLTEELIAQAAQRFFCRI